MSLCYLQLRLRIAPLLLSFCVASASAQTLTFSCVRAERDYLETYELQVKAPFGNSSAQKGKVYLDGRDLDRQGADGSQTIKNVLITKDRVSYLSDTYFGAEVFDGVSYPPGSVTALVMIDRPSGKLRKVETVVGGILSSTLGEGTRVYEEQCALENSPKN